MSTDVAVRANTALTIAEDQTEFSPGQIATLRQLGVDNAGREDLAVFFHVARRTGLDPFARQIYMVGRWSKQGTKFTIQTGIDGYRLIARRAVDRTRETLGYEDTLWCGTDGKWVDVWLAKENPAAAKVTVLRNGERYSAVALFSEYAQTTKDGGYTQMWRDKGALMIAKCAEALALRKAFPQDLSGLYTAEEMAQADNEPRPTFERPQQPQHGSAVSRLAAAASAPVDPVTGDSAAEVDWVNELDLAGDDVSAIKAIWRRAKGLNAEQWVIDTIEAAGAAAAANAAPAEPVQSEIIDEEQTA